VPKEFLSNRSRQEFSSLNGFLKNCTLVSYVSKKRKAVILLSTMHHAPNVASDKIMKPEIILDYNMTKGEVDTYDQMIHKQHCLYCKANICNEDFEKVVICHNCNKK